MERLQALYYRKVEMTDLSFKRYLYPQINWDNRLIVIKVSLHNFCLEYFLMISKKSLTLRKITYNGKFEQISRN